MVGMATHVVRVDKDMSVHIDEAGRDVIALGADRAVRLVARQVRADSGDLAACDSNIHRALELGTGVEHFAIGQQQIVFHGFPPRLSR